MILVAGLAVAGLAGIAAAFYFSMRPGDSRARASKPDRGADSRRTDSRSRTGRARSGSGRTADRTGSSTVIDFTGPQRALEDSEPVVSGRRARRGDRVDDAPDGTGPVRRRSREEEPDDAAAAARSRRRVGWRKGSDVDEELWPVEAFGGVSDEQFWDDLASDRPLATTARTAPPEGAARRRPPNAGPLPDLYAGDDRGRGDSARSRGGGRGGTGEGAGTHPQPRLAPDDRTAIQPAVTSPAAVQPYPAAVQPYPAAVQPYPAAVQPYPAAAQPSPVATQPVRVGQQPAEPRRRSRAAVSPDEDPLTSPAYSLRPRGSVGSRAYPSSRRSGDLTRDQYEAAIGQAIQAFSLADARVAGGGYPDGVPSSRQFDRPSPGANGRSRPDGYRSDPLGSDPLRPDPLRSGTGYGRTVPKTPDIPTTAYPYPQQPYGEPTQAVSTPPYGEKYGYGNPAGSWAQGAQGVPAGPDGDPRRASGSRSAGQTSGYGGDGSWGSRPAYPPVSGYRGPYDPRGYDRRLTGPP